MDKFKKLLPTILLLLFELVIGILLLIDGERLTGIIFIIFGILLLVIGLVMLVRTLLEAKRENTAIRTLPLVLSVVLIAVGAIFAAASGSIISVVSFITTVYGIMMIVSGVLKLADSMTLRGYGFSVGFAVFSAILTVVMGIVIVINPFGTAVVIWTVLGIMLIASAVIDIVSLILYGRSTVDIDVTVE